MNEENLLQADFQEPDTTAEVEVTAEFVIPDDVREEITKKAKELKAKHGLRKVFVVVVKGEEDDEKPLYVAYFRRPGLMHFSQYMNFVQKDMIQANRMLAENVFLAGDKELVNDEDLFLYGTMAQLSQIINSRNADLVKA